MKKLCVTLPLLVAVVLRSCVGSAQHNHWPRLEQHNIIDVVEKRQFTEQFCERMSTFQENHGECDLLHHAGQVALYVLNITETANERLQRATEEEKTLTSTEITNVSYVKSVSDARWDAWLALRTAKNSVEEAREKSRYFIHGVLYDQRDLKEDGPGCRECHLSTRIVNCNANTNKTFEELNSYKVKNENNVPQLCRERYMKWDIFVENRRVFRQVEEKLRKALKDINATVNAINRTREAAANAREERRILKEKQAAACHMGTQYSRMKVIYEALKTVTVSMMTKTLHMKQRADALVVSTSTESLAKPAREATYALHGNATAAGLEAKGARDLLAESVNEISRDHYGGYLEAESEFRKSFAHCFLHTDSENALSLKAETQKIEANMTNLTLWVSDMEGAWNKTLTDFKEDLKNETKWNRVTFVFLQDRFKTLLTMIEGRLEKVATPLSVANNTVEKAEEALRQAEQKVSEVRKQCEAAGGDFASASEECKLFLAPPAKEPNVETKASAEGGSEGKLTEKEVAQLLGGEEEEIVFVEEDVVVGVEADVPAESKKGTSSKVWLIVAIIPVVMIACGAGAFFLLRRSAPGAKGKVSADKCKSKCVDVDSNDSVIHSFIANPLANGAWEEDELMYDNY
ncbi:hypothetical protein, conserved in T. vivax [Trypanosoma vivax Y486]|uniref:Uncharacterized protein n=1 Tax=Trypanosoma vivax (strain Y486) TaxID=1055687 RepID=F9WLE3_TRYVY|nr:hypothetical protein, conserved in T. vivax [Trypanosoma vivax Y486]|eukprot:CCD18334.1 hypothetical protein, conserved in T. vivax [Trypanosoma vivax Y486]